MRKISIGPFPNANPRFPRPRPEMCVAGLKRSPSSTTANTANGCGNCSPKQQREWQWQQWPNGNCVHHPLHHHHVVGEDLVFSPSDNTYSLSGNQGGNKPLSQQEYADISNPFAALSQR